MTDHQKIHPVVHDPEAPPTVPLVPRGSFRSDQPEGGAAVIIPKYPPLPPPHHRKRRSCCCKCFCWTFSLILIVLIILGILTAVFFLVYQPKIPKYSVDRMRITNFNLANDNIDASFNVNITARNPNKKIGIYYEEGSHISVWYTGSKLCQGTLPKFYQGHRNTTVLDLILSGQTQNATGLFQSLQVQQQTGIIPLDLIANVPVRLKVGSLKLMKWEFKVRCALDVDSLRTDNTISIRSSRCKYRFSL